MGATSQYESPPIASHASPAGRLRSAEWRAAVGQWRVSIAGRRSAALRDLEAGPISCPIARYLIACDLLEHGRVATAVRHYMIAHHAEPDVESAALLVFAGLNWLGRRSDPLLAVLLDTWEEFRRPEFDRREKERLLLDAFAETTPPPSGLSPLARRLYRLPLPSLRAELRQACARPDAGGYPLLVTPA